MRKHLSIKSAAVSLGALLGAVGLATVAGALPGQASDGISTAEEKSGLELPQSDNEHRQDPEASDVEASDEGEDPTDGGEAQNDHGAAVSELARTTELEGAEKGAAIADLASEGRSSARGESGDAGSTGTERAEAGATNAGTHGRP